MTYEAFFHNARWWVRYAGKLLGGYSANPLRTYVFPLYTPQGRLVLQEAPPDHPHHQGIFAGLEINGYDLWAAGSFNRPRHRQESTPPLAKIEPVISSTGVMFTHTISWKTHLEKICLRENRTVRLSSQARFTLVEWASQFSSPKPVTELGQTKEAGIGLRVPPHWETGLGGQIRNALGQQGEAECFDQPAPWLNVQGGSARNRAGVIFVPHPHSELCSWFSRDYGLQLYNPCRHHPITLQAGQSIVWTVRVLAYDGDLSLDQINALVEAI